MSTTTATLARTYRHECDHGFCTVCGSVWPCSRAEAVTAPPALPTPRLPELPLAA